MIPEREVLTALLKGAQAVLKHRRFEDAARAIFLSCKESIGATAGYVALLSEDGDRNKLLFLDPGGLTCSVDPALAMPIRGLRADAYRTGRAVYHNAFSSSEWAAFLPPNHARLDNVLFVPLLMEGRAIGLLGLANKAGGFGEDDARLAAASAATQFADRLDDRHVIAYDGMLPHGHYCVPILSRDKVLGVLNLYTEEGHSRDPHERGLSGDGRQHHRRDHRASEGRRATTAPLFHPGGDLGFRRHGPHRWPVDVHQLNSILGFSEILRDGVAGEVSMEQREYLNDVWESGSHLLQLINDILDISKIEAGKMELELGEVDLTALLNETLVFFREKAARHTISLHAEVADDVSVVIADERKIKQVLINLLTNALKFTPDGGEVGVCAAREGGEVQVSVWDTGIGIAPEDLGRLFQPFQQLESVLTKKHEGTGLGLNLSRKIVEMHGGRIWVESTPGQGSRFTFAILVVSAAENAEKG